MAHAQCLCGDVAFEADPPLQFVHDCHCTRCQKSHGTGSVTMAAVTRDGFRWLRGEDRLSVYATSAEGRRAFCRRCGSAMPNGSDFAGLVFVPIGPLEGEYEAVSDGHIFAASKAPWHDIDDGRPVYDGYPPGIDAAVLEVLSRGGASPGNVGGSCLCGAVTWASEGKPVLARRCHCMRCRRARAHSHAANAFVPGEAFEWTGGEGNVELYKVPEAERFSQAFCRTCGSKVPWWIEGRGLWNVPLGGLDDDPGVKPSEHIFVGSKAPWFEIHDDLPRHDAGPK